MNFCKLSAVVAMLLFSTSAGAQAPQDARLVEVVPIVSHSEPVSSVSFSPNGARILTVSSDGSAKLWDVKTGRLIRTWGRHLVGIYLSAAAFSPDGNQIVTGGGDKILRLWDAASGGLLRSFAGHMDAIVGVAFSPDGTRLASASQDRSIKLWYVASGQLIRTIPVRITQGGWSGPLAFSPDGLRIASGSTADGTNALLSLWDATTGQLLRNYTFPGASKVGAEASTDRIAFSPDGSQLLSGGHNQPMKLWDAASGRLLRTYGSAEAFAVALSRDGTRALSGEGKEVKLWETQSGRLLQTFPYPEQVYESSIAFSPDETQVLSMYDKTAMLWDAASGKLIRAFGGQSQAVHAIALSTDGVTLVSGGNDKAVRYWDATAGRLIRVIDDHPDFVESIALSRDGTKVMTSGGRAIAFSLDSARVASVTDESVKLREVPSGRSLRTVAWSSPSKTGATINLWETETGRLIRTFVPPVASWASWISPTVNSIQFSSDGGRLLIAGDDNAVKLLDATNGRVLRSYQDSNGVYSVALSPDGTLAASGTYATLGTDKSVKIWDNANGRMLRKLEGHTDGVHSVVFAPDGTWVVSGSDDATIKLWDVASGQLLRTLAGHFAGVRSLAISSDGTRLVSASEDTTIKIWESASGGLLVSILGATNGEWVAITPEGFFSASEKGAELLSAVRGFEVYSMDQFYQSLYRPDLVREKLAGDPRGLVRQAAASLDLNKVIASGSAPDVRLTLPGGGSGRSNVDGATVSAEAELIDRGGGIGRVEWRVNGVTSGIETRGLQRVDTAAPAARSPTVRQTLALEPGENRIEVVAYNGANLIASVPARLTVTAQGVSPSIVPPQPGAPSAAPLPGPVAAGKPRLFVLVAGINDYADKSIQLTYAVSDAREVARGFKESAGDLYQSVEVRLMTDAEVTRDKLDAAFANMAGKAQPSDVFVLYLAGHGKTVDGRYYFIPQDFTIDGDFTDNNVNASVKARAIAQEQWQHWFASIAARKSVILFDTCDSGTLAGDAGETQQLEKGAANERLARATGRSILTASGGSQEALEGYHGPVELSELAAYVYARVSDLSQKLFKRRQVPEIRIATNFPLARQTRILQDETTPVAEAKPAYQVAQTAQLQIQPNSGATIVRSLSAKTPVTVLESKNGWSLIASEGRPLGYVATRDLAPAQ
jgi:WD40 repeat protein